MCILKMSMSEIYYKKVMVRLHTFDVKLVQICYDLPQTKKKLALFWSLGSPVVVDNVSVTANSSVGSQNAHVCSKSWESELPTVGNLQCQKAELILRNKSKKFKKTHLR